MFILIMLLRRLRYVLLIVFLIFCLHPGRFATHYDFVKHEDVYYSLNQQTNPKVSTIKQDKCDYQNLVDSISENTFEVCSSLQAGCFHGIIAGGEYLPMKCKPRFSTAIIIPFRNRTDHLDYFLLYMHSFLRRQNIHYRIFVVEQYDEQPFNRAKLLNIGAKMAMGLGFPCLFLHDVDLLPLDGGNIYACSTFPRHVSSSLDIFRYNLPYKTLFGGAIAILSDTFKKVNGMSNKFYGWGGEDDDFSARIAAQNISIIRFPPYMSRYTMIRHIKQTPSPNRHKLLNNGYQRYHTDGLNSLNYKQKAFKLHPLFTHIMAEI